MMKYNCLNCGKSFALRYKTAGKFCSPACSQTSRRKREIRACKTCQKPFSCVPSRAKIYCSHECSVCQTAEALRKIYPVKSCAKCGRLFEHRRRDTEGKYCSRICSDSVNKKPPALPPITKKCPLCEREFTYRTGRKITCCSILCARRARAKSVRGESHPSWKSKTPMSCEICGTVKLVKPSLVARFRSCSRRCNALLALQTMPRISSLEVRMSEAFRSIGLSPSPQFVIDYFIVDFAFVDERLAVECDGTYWHGREEQKKKDRKKDGYLKSKGWRVLRLKEDEIKSSPSDCVAFVLKHLAGVFNP